MLMTVPQSQELRACGAQVRIYIDGADLTRWCFAADDVHGDVSFGYDLRPDTSVEAM
jgi:hypothetical protein